MMRTTDEMGVRAVLLPVIGNPVWGVRQFFGSRTHLEFGAPHLWIREPVLSARRTLPPSLEKIRRQRRIQPEGKWQIVLEMCAWRVRLDAEILIHSESDRDSIAKAACGDIDGRIIESISIDTTNGTTAFCFESGLTIDTWPVEAPHTQWHLREEGGRYFHYRGDGGFAYGAAQTVDADLTWWRTNKARLEIC